MRHDGVPDAARAALSALRVDYSAEELDALSVLLDLRGLAELFGEAIRPDESMHRRALHEAAMRALVARHAVRVEGETGREVVELLEPHATVLGVLSSPHVALRVQRWAFDAVEQRVYASRAGEAVELRSVAFGVHSATLLAPAAARELVEAFTAITARGPGVGPPVVASAGSLVRVEEALRAGNLDGARARLAKTSSAAAEILYARVATIRLARILPGATRRLALVDAGELGLWRVEEETVPSRASEEARVTLSPLDPIEVYGLMSLKD